MCFQPSYICCCRSLSRIVALALYQSLLLTHTLCLGAARPTHGGNAQTVLQVLSSLNEENSSSKPSLELSSTPPCLNFFAQKLLEQHLKLPSVGTDFHVCLLKQALLRTFPASTVRSSWAALVSCWAPNPSAPCFLDLALQRALWCDWTAITPCQWCSRAVHMGNEGTFLKFRTSCRWVWSSCSPKYNTEYMLRPCHFKYFSLMLWTDLENVTY